MEEVRVHDWTELNEWLYEGAWQEPLGRFRSRYAFRGMGDAAYDLRTSLMQMGPSSERQEGHLLRNFRKYASRDAVPGDSVWNWLALAQHHGLPTRLRDWTFSPFVALHFATERVLFPGLDGLSRWLKRYYTPAETQDSGGVAPERDDIRETGANRAQ